MKRDTEAPMVAHAINVGGNWFEVARQLNDLGIARYMVAVSALNSYNCQVMLCLPADTLKQLQDAKRIF